MRLEKPEPWKLIIKSSMLPAWIFRGAFSVGTLFLLINLWIIANFIMSQEVVGASLLLLLFLCYSLSSFRLPTIKTTFDKHNNYFTVEKEWIWLSRTEKYPIALIKNIQVVQKGRFGKAREYFKIKVELFSEEPIPVSAGNYRPERRVRMIANELIEFLKTTNISDLATKQN